MLRSLKDGIFSTDREKKKVDNEAPEKNLGKITYVEHGFERAKDNHGNTTALKIELNKIYQWHKDEARKNRKEQEELKKPTRIKIQELKSENEELNEKNEHIEENEKPKLYKKIDELKERKRNIKENPETITDDKVSRASFYIGFAIIVFLTIYLIVFYSSASYSAFFKHFGRNELCLKSSS